MGSDAISALASSDSVKCRRSVTCRSYPPRDGAALRANIAALPGFGEMKIKALGSVLAKRYGVAAAQELVPWHPTLGDVDSAQALTDYQAAKRIHKQEWTRGRTPAA